ncbi:FixH family protein [Bacillus sp. JCM 19034]|uniref:FixH family protein n=1 Tax=Bacillus sp. JCM 19034 TaxID=1481928 RepID=UPI000785C762|nr:FixH family protein [Bacillus sp. JCM 19034]
MKVVVRKSFERSYLFAFFMCMLSLIFFLVTYFQMEQQVVDWHVTVVSEDLLYTGDVSTIHLYVVDEFNEPIEDANISAIFDRPETVHQIEKTFTSIGNGLYEANVIFSVPGQWVSLIEAKKGRNVYQNQLFLTVEGEIAARSRRDPDDLFNLNQSLPDDLEIELQRIFKRSQ